MKRSLLICAAALMVLVSVPQVQADNAVLTLDLRLNNRTNPNNGGTWSLFARKAETGGGAQGDNGISGIRALLNNVDAGSVTFATGINHSISCDGGPCVQTLGNNTVEIVYGQNIGATGVVTGVGVNANANLDRLIASGTFAGALPTFGDDGSTPTAFRSEVNFLGGASAPFPISVIADSVVEERYVLGDMNGSNTVTNLDIQLFINRLPGASTPMPYHPAGDINQSGTISNLDTQPFITILQGPALTASVGAVPEPTSFGLALLASMGLIARRSRG